MSAGTDRIAGGGLRGASVVMSEFDPFAFYRTLLFVFLGIYTVLTMVSAVARVCRLLAGGGTGKRLLRLYLSYQLVSIRLRPFAGELLQIGLLVAMLVVIAWLHALVGPAGVAS